MPPARKSEKVRVIITGGTGFIGQLVARAILRRGSLLVHQPSGIEAEAEVSEVVLADVGRPPQLMFAELEDSCTFFKKDNQLKFSLSETIDCHIEDDAAEISGKEYPKTPKPHNV